jgi:hypothetical protein
MSSDVIHANQITGWSALELIQDVLWQDADCVSRRRAQELSVVYVLIDEAIRHMAMEAGFAKFGNLHFGHRPIRKPEGSAKKAQRKVGPSLKYCSGLTEGWSTRDPFFLLSSPCAGASFA